METADIAIIGAGNSGFAMTGHLLSEGLSVRMWNRPDEDLFTPFLTKKKDGTGLGLAIVHRIVIAHRGSVSYSNRIEGGAQFDVRLPIERAAPTNAVGGGTD